MSNAEKPKEEEEEVTTKDALVSFLFDLIRMIRMIRPPRLITAHKMRRKGCEASATRKSKPRRSRPMMKSTAGSRRSRR